MPAIHDANLSVSSLGVTLQDPCPCIHTLNLGGPLDAYSDEEMDVLGFVRSPMPKPLRARLMAITHALSTDTAPSWALEDASEPDFSGQEDLSPAEILLEKERILSEFADVLVDEIPSELPPFRAVNHRIPLIDESKKIRPKSIPIPYKYRDQFLRHMNKYIEAGWWHPIALDSASPMFAVPKANPAEGRFVVNLKERNANTVREETPIPDMQEMRAAVAADPYRSKFDFKAAFEQVRVVPEHVQHTGFKTPYGTMVSNIMQFGDLNAPNTLHRLLSHLFPKYRGRWFENFFDDAFIHSQMACAHIWQI